MNTINKYNYESFFLDHIEGSLDAEQSAALMRFLDENPQLREELEGFEMVTVEPDSKIHFDYTATLKKPVVSASGNINEHNYEVVFAAFSEGDLSQPEIEQIYTFLDLNPHLVRELELLKKCRLQQNDKIILPDKSSLKKPLVFPIFTRRLYYAIAGAASLALLIGLSFLFRPEPTNKNFTVTNEPVVVTGPEAPGSQVTEPLAEHKPVQATPGRKFVAENDLPSEISETADIHTPLRDLPSIKQMASLNIPLKIFKVGTPTPVLSEQKYFSGYYADIALAQNIRHAEINQAEPSPEKLLALGTAVLREIIQPGQEDLNLLPGQINFWKIADAGISGLAWLTGANLELSKTTDSDGRVTSFTFQSQSLVINQNLRKNK